jgi:nucleoid-associated protein YgaU
VRLIRNSLRKPGGVAVRALSAAVALGFGLAWGGGAAAPTPTPVTSSAPTVAAAPAASPQRPPLASPLASPSAAASAAATSVAATPDATGGTTYDVQSGDTLAVIAQQQYGDGTQWRRIYDANKDAIGADPDKLKLGMTLKIPPKATPTP